MKDSGEIWMGAIPHDWSLGKLKYVAPEQRLAAQRNCRYIGLENIESGTGRLISYSNGDENNALVIKKGDVLFGKLRPYLSKSLLVKEDASCSSEFAIMRPRKISAKFLTYITLDPAFVNQIDVSTYGTKMPRANWSYIGNLLVPIPDASEQKAISSYLDSHINPIDEAISRHRQAIEKLEEYHRAVVTQTVTKGLDSEVRLKDSAINWIGMMPESWHLTKIKYVAKVTSGSTPKSKVPEYWDGDIPFITPADYSAGDHYISKGGRCITREGMNSCSTSLLPTGSVIISTRAPIGLVAINAKPVCINQGCKGLVRRNEDFDFEYLYLLLSIADKALNALGNGTTYLELSKRSLSNFVIPKPSLQEQRAITAYLNEQCTPIGQAVVRHQLLIQKLEEYRKSLIHAAVTGRIDCAKEPL